QAPQESRARYGHADQTGRIRGKGEGGAAALESLGELELRMACRALGEHPRGDRGDQPPIRRREEPAGADRSGEGDRRVEVVFEHEEARSVWKRAHGNRFREPTACAGGRTPTHSSSSSGPAAPSFGRKRPAVNPSSWKCVRATRWTSSTETRRMASG